MKITFLLLITVSVVLCAPGNPGTRENPTESDKLPEEGSNVQKNPVQVPLNDDPAIGSEGARRPVPLSEPAAEKVPTFRS